ncbi:LLM class flavin-dependent oxidoreductase [bacterium]|nr:LLM class flavin-dependent oxidoreductase [bacterium]
MAVEFWTTGVGIPHASARRAQRAEADRYDGMTVVDSQNLSGDPYVALALAAQVTTTLRLGTGVTNPVTRHAAATASAIASVQGESGGRAVLGIGRGDSALAHLGLAPAPLPVFERYLHDLHAYLAREEVPFRDGATIDRLRLANQPTSSRIQWLRPGYPPVPIDVAATGPKVIAIAAREADQISFAVGADPKRLRWGIGVAREARERAGLDPGSIPFGAYVNVVVHEDVGVAVRMAEGGLSLFARFSAMHGRTNGPTTAEEQRVMTAIHDGYDMNRHSQAGSPQAALLTEEFAREFGIIGPASYCVERLNELIEIGLTRFVISGPAGGSGEAAEAEQRFVHDVMPALRRAS